jgi:hypothetical protein
MSESNPEQTKQTVPQRQGGRFRWLIEPQRRRLLLPICGLWILALDWLLFSSNVFSLGLATPIVVAIGFLLSSVGTYYFQSQLSGDKMWSAAVKAIFAGIVVGVPWPLTGTLIGGWVLFVSGLGKIRKEVT